MSPHTLDTHDDLTKSDFSTFDLVLLRETAQHYEARLLQAIPRTALDSAIRHPNRSRVALLGAVVVAGLDYQATKVLLEKSKTGLLVAPPETRCHLPVSVPKLNPFAKTFTPTVTCTTVAKSHWKTALAPKLPRTCARCGLSSHVAADCPNKAAAAAAAWKAALADAVCFRCGGKGHVRAHCPDPVKKQQQHIPKDFPKPRHGIAAAATASWRKPEQVAPQDAPEEFPPLPGKQMVH